MLPWRYFNVPDLLDDNEDDDENENEFDRNLIHDLSREVFSHLDKIIKSEEFSFEGKTIVQFGAPSSRSMFLIKTIPFVERFIFLYTNENILEEATEHLRPLPYDFLVKRDSPLVVEQYAGCITKWDSKFIGIEPKIFAIVVVEMIQGLETNLRVEFEKNIFGLISPPVVLTAFYLKPGDLFDMFAWSEKICQLYQYTPQIFGPQYEADEEFRSFAKFIIFKRSSIAQSEKSKQEKYPGILFANTYKLISKTEYPFYRDQRTVSEKIVDEYKHFVNVHRILSLSKLKKFWENETKTAIVSINYFFETIQDKLNKTNCQVPIVLNYDQIYDVLKAAGYEIQFSNGETIGIKKYKILVNIPSELDFLGEPDMVVEENEKNEKLKTPILDIQLPEEDWETSV